MAARSQGGGVGPVKGFEGGVESGLRNSVKT